MFAFLGIGSYTVACGEPETPGQTSCLAFLLLVKPTGDQHVTDTQQFYWQNINLRIIIPSEDAEE